MTRRDFRIRRKYYFSGNHSFFSKWINFFLNLIIIFADICLLSSLLHGITNFSPHAPYLSKHLLVFFSFFFYCLLCDKIFSFKQKVFDRGKKVDDITFTIFNNMSKFIKKNLLFLAFSSKQINYNNALQYMFRLHNH